MGTIRNGVREYRATTDYATPIKGRAATRRNMRRKFPEDHFRPLSKVDVEIITGKLSLALHYGSHAGIDRFIDHLDEALEGRAVTPGEDFIIDIVGVEAKCAIEDAHAVITLQDLCRRCTATELAETPGLRLKEAERIVAAASRRGLRWKS